MASLGSKGEAPERHSRGRRIRWAFAAAALLSAVMVVGAQSSGAATTKTFNASCKGADAGSAKLLGLIGSGTLVAPITSVTDAPSFVEPGQTDVGFTVKWSLNLDAQLATTAAGVAKSVDVSNVKTAIAIDGPTSSAGSLPVAFPPQSFPLVANKPISSSFPPVSGTLNDIGNGGVIKLKSTTLTFTIQLKGVSAALASVAGGPINLTCSTGATLASIPVKIAGSPDIVQPIEIPTVAGQSTTVDVLGDYVTNGTTKDGVERPVDASSLKVIEGDAQVVDGKLVATAPPAGQSADITFGVCAGTAEIAAADPGSSETQEIKIFFDPVNQGGKRMMAVQFGFTAPAPLPPEGAAPPEATGDGAATEAAATDAAADPAGGNAAAEGDAPTAETVGQPLWTARNIITGQWETGPVPQPWADNVNNYAIFSRFDYPTAAMVQTALESVPSIGPGNVEVTQGAITHVEKPPFEGFDAYQQNVLNGLFGDLQYTPYTVKFKGALANRAVGNITTPDVYAFLPLSIKEGLTGLLGGGADGGEGGGESTKTPIPGADGVPDLPPPAGPIDGDAATYLKYLQGQVNSQPVFSPEWVASISLFFKVLGENPTALIDLNFATALIDLVFQKPPEVNEIEPGEDPTPAQIQELCSQGVVTLTSATVASETTVPTDVQANTAVKMSVTG